MFLRLKAVALLGLKYSGAALVNELRLRNKIIVFNLHEPIT